MVRRRLLVIAGWLLGSVVVIGILPISVGTESRYTCTLCRAERIDKTFLGLPWQSFHDTEFTEWHKAHRPDHEHAWGWQGTIRGIALLGMICYRGCGRQHPACQISPSMLRTYCEQADESAQAMYFDGITSADHHTQEQTVQTVMDSPIWSKK